MFDAIEAAKKRPFDYLLWLNDDVAMDPDAIERLLTCSARVETEQGSPLNVVCGAMRDDATGDLSYGGFERTNAWNPSKLRHMRPAENAPRQCDTINGNLVLVPAAVLARVGNVDKVFRHTLGDIDFGYRVRRATGTLWLAPGFLGHCAANPGTTPWTNGATSMRARLFSLTSPRGLPLGAWTTFMWRWGKVSGLILMVGMYLKALTAVVFARPAGPDSSISTHNISAPVTGETL
jgi:GT2 family glycosyltransferase